MTCSAGANSGESAGRSNDAALDEEATTANHARLMVEDPARGKRAERRCDAARARQGQKRGHATPDMELCETRSTTAREVGSFNVGSAWDCTPRQGPRRSWDSTCGCSRNFRGRWDGRADDETRRVTKRRPRSEWPATLRAWQSAWYCTLYEVHTYTPWPLLSTTSKQPPARPGAAHTSRSAVYLDDYIRAPALPLAQNDGGRTGWSQLRSGPGE